MEAMERKYIDRIPWYGHPFWWPTSAAIFLLYFALYAYMWIRIREGFERIIGPHRDLADSPEIRQYFSDWNSPWIALAAGVFVGLVTTGIMYSILRKTRDVQIELYILHPSQRSRSLKWQGFLYVLPLPAVTLLLWLVFEVFQPLPPLLTQAFFMAIWIPTGLLYFECKQIYMEAQAKLQSHKSGNSGSLELSS